MHILTLLLPEMLLELNGGFFFICFLNFGSCSPRHGTALELYLQVSISRYYLRSFFSIQQLPRGRA